MLRVRLEDGPGALAPLRERFRADHPGHDLEWVPGARALAPAGTTRVAFVQDGGARGALVPAEGGATRALPPADEPPLACGDVLVLAPGAALELEGAGLDLLVFHLPDAPPPSLPALLRPDVGVLAADAPGGCAEEDDAYRRILLTWDARVGPHVLHGLNAHRVTMTDSLTHYHPREGGFDELYLVQGVRPGAGLYTCADAEGLAAEAARDEPWASADELRGRLTRTELSVGDLVLVPRGTGHRAVGGVLAQVITVPGFVPGAEIGLDADLRRLGERAGLTPDELPYRAASSHGPVVR